MIFQETRDVIWGHIDGVLSPSSRGVVASSFATFGTVCHFLATDAGLMSSVFAVEALIFLYKLLLFGIGMHLSHSVSVNIYGISSLGGGAWSGSFVSSILVFFPWFGLGVSPKAL